jgi:hypothetical protein
VLTVHAWRVVATPLAVASLSACGSGGGDASESSAAEPGTTAIATTETEAATTEVAATAAAGQTISRDTEIAVRRCVDANSFTGQSRLTGDTEAYDQAKAACDEAQVLLEVDSQGVVGPTPPNAIAASIAKRVLDLSFLDLKALGDPTAAATAAAELDGSYSDWKAEIEALIEQGRA